MTIVRPILAAAAATLAWTSIARADGDPAAGEQSFTKCLPCHSIGPDGKE